MSELFVGIFCRVMLAELEIGVSVLFCLPVNLTAILNRRRPSCVSSPAAAQGFSVDISKEACLFHLTSFLEASTSYISLFRALHSCFWCLSSLLKTSGRVAHSSDNYLPSFNSRTFWTCSDIAFRLRILHVLEHLAEENTNFESFPCFVIMLGYQFAHSAAPLRKVKEVQFGILSPEEIVRARILFYGLSH